MIHVGDPYWLYMNECEQDDENDAIANELREISSVRPVGDAEVRQIMRKYKVNPNTITRERWEEILSKI